MMTLQAKITRALTAREEIHSAIERIASIVSDSECDVLRAALEMVDNLIDRMSRAAMATKDAHA